MSCSNWMTCACKDFTKASVGCSSATLASHCVRVVMAPFSGDALTALAISRSLLLFDCNPDARTEQRRAQPLFHHLPAARGFVGQ